MENLPPKSEVRVVRTRTFKVGPDGLVRLLRDLKRERLTGEVTVNVSQGGVGPVMVRDSQVLSEEGT